eukprot:TRINITY_DN26545_c0_g1_i2.p1 TRINITY_DN26545_c0_g1~~TRINITY_DN26545_c0_g1_i2.p1  ORF type:complete len:221 (-),score=30.45 TRINITY_DN26545_c0_g1_i2:131-727(-)
MALPQESCRVPVSTTPWVCEQIRPRRRSSPKDDIPYSSSAEAQAVSELSLDFNGLEPGCDARMPCATHWPDTDDEFSQTDLPFASLPFHALPKPCKDSAEALGAAGMVQFERTSALDFAVPVQQSDRSMPVLSPSPDSAEGLAALAAETAAAAMVQLEACKSQWQSNKSFEHWGASIRQLRIEASPRPAYDSFGSPRL